MGLFDLLKKKENTIAFTTDNGVLGPTFFDGLTTNIDNPKDLLSHEWRRQLKSKSGQTKFKIRYYGVLHSEYKNLIVGTDFAPSLVYAVDSTNGEEILLFDGCSHGYDAIFCNTYSIEQVNNRQATELYIDEDSNNTFEIIISTYNGFDFNEEMGEEIDENGFIELDNGNKIEFEKVKRNGFDTLQIWAKNENGKTIDIVSEELA